MSFFLRAVVPLKDSATSVLPYCEGLRGPHSSQSIRAPKKRHWASLLIAD